MLAVLFENFLKRKVLAVQEFTNLLASSFERAFSPPHYVIDTLVQMDIIGFGSLPIVLLTGFFTGAVLALQTYRTLSTFEEVGLLGEVVALSIVRELGPVLTALMVAGRNSSGIASEIGSMLVSEQVDAMRALGTDPLRKLVLPRLFATLLTLPLLTILSDFFGMMGGYLVSSSTVRLTRYPPIIPKKSERMVRRGNVRRVANKRGRTSLRSGSVPRARIASTCSLTSIEPISDAMPELFLPATISAVSTGPSSRTIDSATTSPSSPTSPKVLRVR